MDKKILIGQVDSWRGIKNDTTNEIEYSFLYIVSKVKQNGLPELIAIPMYDCKTKKEALKLWKEITNNYPKIKIKDVKTV